MSFLIAIYYLFTKLIHANNLFNHKITGKHSKEEHVSFNNSLELKEFDKGKCLKRGGIFLAKLNGNYLHSFLTIDVDNMILQFRNLCTKNNLTELDSWEKKVHEMINCRNFNKSTKLYSFLNESMIKKKVMEYVSNQINIINQNHINKENVFSKQKTIKNRLWKNIKSNRLKYSNKNRLKHYRKRLVTQSLIIDRNDQNICSSHLIKEKGLKIYSSAVCKLLFESRKKKLEECSKIRNFCKVCCKERTWKLESSKKCMKKCERIKNLRKIHVIKRRKFEKKLNEITIKINEINNTKTNRYYSQAMKEKLIHKKKKELKNFIIKQVNPIELNKKFLQKLLSMIKPFRKIYEKVQKKVDELAINKNMHNLGQINGEDVFTNLLTVQNTTDYQNFSKYYKISFNNSGFAHKTSKIDLNRMENGDLIYNNYKQKRKFNQNNMSKHEFDMIDKNLTLKGFDSKLNQSFLERSLGHNQNSLNLRRLILNSSKEVNIKVINSTKPIDPRKLMITIIKYFIKMNEKIYDKKDTPKLIEYVGKILQDVSNKTKTIKLTANSFLKFIVNITKKLSKLYKKRRSAILRGNDYKLGTNLTSENMEIIKREDKSLNKAKQNDKF